MVATSFLVAQHTQEEVGERLGDDFDSIGLRVAISETVAAPSKTLAAQTIRGLAGTTSLGGTTCVE